MALRAPALAAPALAALTLTGLLGSAPARADTVSARADRTAVVIYRDIDDGLAMITETRTVTVEAGESRIRFEGVAEGMVPETVAIDGLPPGMLERNHDFDLLSPGSLIERSVGREVTLVRTQPGSGRATQERATLRSGPHGMVLDFGGRVEALKCSGLPERLVFDKVPDGLTDRPTLSVKIRAAETGTYTVRLSYLAKGLSWQAGYVAEVRPDGRTLDLTGWITLTNDGGTTFADAPVGVVAGALEVDWDTRPAEVEAVRALPACWRTQSTHARHPIPPRRPQSLGELASSDSSEIVVTAQRRQESVQDVPIAVSAFAKQSNVGDYKLYTLPGPTTVAAHQSKQVAMLRRDGVKATRFYGAWVSADELDGEPAVLEVWSVMRLKNTAAMGLGKPLPAGGVTVTEDGPYGRLATGYTQIRDTPVGLPFTLRLSVSPGIRAEGRVLRQTAVGEGDDRRYRADVEIAVTNTLEGPADFELVQGLDSRDGERLVAAERRYDTGEGLPRWKLRIAPGSTQRVRYTLETRYPIREPEPRR